MVTFWFLMGSLRIEFRFFLFFFQNLNPTVLNGKSRARTLVHSGSKCANACRCNVCTYVYMHVCVAAEYGK